MLRTAAQRMDQVCVRCNGTPLSSQQTQAVDAFYTALSTCRDHGLSRQEVYDLLTGLLKDAGLQHTDIIYEEVTLLLGWCDGKVIPQLRFMGEPEEDAALIDYVRDGKWRCRGQAMRGVLFRP